MRAHMLTLLAFTFVFSVRGFSQAAAESVILNSNSAAATAKTGSTLGDALNTAGGNVANRITTVTKGSVAQPTSPNRGVKPVVSHTAQNSSATSSTATKPSSAASSMIRSIQGGQLVSTPTQKPAGASVGTPPATQK